MSLGTAVWVGFLGLFYLKNTFLTPGFYIILFLSSPSQGNYNGLSTYYITLQFQSITKVYSISSLSFPTLSIYPPAISFIWAALFAHGLL